MAQSSVTWKMTGIPKSARLRWIVQALCLMALRMAGGNAQAAAVPMTLTGSAPTQYPQPGSVQVPWSARIVLSFNGPVSPNQLNLLTTDSTTQAKIQVTPSFGANGVPLDLSANVSGNAIVVSHLTPFDAGTNYVISVSGIATSDHTNFIDTPTGQLVPTSGAAANPFTFRTLEIPAPYIANHTPTNNDNSAVGPNGAVAATDNIQVVFSKAMDTSSVIANTTIVAYIYGGPTVNLKPNVVFTFDTTGTTLTITPKNDANGFPIPYPASRSANQPTRITVNVGGTDIVGNVLGGNPNGVNSTNQNPFTFRVAIAIPPGLASSSPSSGQQSVDPRAPVVLRFDGPVNCAALTTQSQADPFAATFLIYGMGTDPISIDLPQGTVSAACSDGGRTVTLSHDFSFGLYQRYAVRILGLHQVPIGELDDSLQGPSGGELQDSITVPFTVGPAVIPGDLDGDGHVDGVDVHLILLLYLGVGTPSPLEMAAGDVRPKNPDGSYGDGKIRSDDVNWVFRRFLGLETAP